MHEDFATTETVVQHERDAGRGVVELVILSFNFHGCVVVPIKCNDISRTLHQAKIRHSRHVSDCSETTDSLDRSGQLQGYQRRERHVGRCQEPGVFRSGVLSVGLHLVLELPEVTTQSAIERLVGELSNAGHLFVMHKCGMRCRACNPFLCLQTNQFLEQNTVYTPATVQLTFSQVFRARKRQHSTAAQ